MNINYIGLSREMCNLLDPNHMNQVMEWALERKSYGDVIHVWGSLPCAPCIKAYLQAILRSPIATWVVLPFLCWLPGWEYKFKRPCVRLRRALYGHPEAGDDWFAHLSEVLESKMGFKLVEGMPSMWWNPTTRVLTAAYVDEIMASGPAKACEEFWKVLRSHICDDR